MVLRASSRFWVQLRAVQEQLALSVWMAVLLVGVGGFAAAPVTAASLAALRRGVRVKPFPIRSRPLFGQALVGLGPRSYPS